MKFSIVKSEPTDESEVIYLEPETDREREALEHILAKYPRQVAGFGRIVNDDKSIGGIRHMELRLEKRLDEP